MPIYAYKCSNCGHELDSLQKISDAPLSVCPSCGQATLVKQVTAAGFQLKGSGWYATDFRNGTPKKEAAAGAAAKSESSSDSKSAAADSKGSAESSSSKDAGSSKESSGSKDSPKDSSSSSTAKSSDAAPVKTGTPPPASS